MKVAGNRSPKHTSRHYISRKMLVVYHSTAGNKSGHCEWDQTQDGDYPIPQRILWAFKDESLGILLHNDKLGSDTAKAQTLLQIKMQKCQGTKGIACMSGGK